jgi:hypothetical protein
VEVVVGGNEGTVAAYEFRSGALAVKQGWPAREHVQRRTMPRSSGHGGGGSRR